MAFFSYLRVAGAAPLILTLGCTTAAPALPAPGLGAGAPGSRAAAYVHSNFFPTAG